MKTYRSSLSGADTDLTICWNSDLNACDVMHLLKDAIQEICKTEADCENCMVIDVPKTQEV